MAIVKRFIPRFIRCIHKKQVVNLCDKLQFHFYFGKYFEVKRVTDTILSTH